MILKKAASQNKKKKKGKKKERKGEGISRLWHCTRLKNVWLLRHDVQRHMLRYRCMIKYCCFPLFRYTRECQVNGE